jgi:hypothetical protein
MARVKIEDVIDSLGHDIRRALEEAVKQVIPHAQFDTRTLFKAFVRAVGRKCNTWERVSDSYVELD